jgi:hypothetical protein
MNQYVLRTFGIKGFKTNIGWADQVPRTVGPVVTRLSSLPYGMTRRLLAFWTLEKKLAIPSIPWLNVFAQMTAFPLVCRAPPLWEARQAYWQVAKYRTWLSKILMCLQAESLADATDDGGMISFNSLAWAQIMV